MHTVGNGCNSDRSQIGDAAGERVTESFACVPKASIMSLILFTMEQRRSKELVPMVWIMLGQGYINRRTQWLYPEVKNHL